MTVTPPDDREFAELLDDLLQRLLDGEPVDRDGIAARHAAVAHRLDEAFALAEGVAGRRPSSRPALHGYEILRELGRGGMGTVYLARQQQLDRTVALKVLPHSLGLSTSGRQRFVAEARTLARVEHEHIVRIHRIVDDGELLAFEMEYVDGPSLQQVLHHLRGERSRGRGPATLADVATGLGVPVEALAARTPMQFFVRTALLVARALAAVHALQLVHRDVKPANVLLRRDGKPVLVDFGLARWHDADGTHTRGFAGTPVYAAPEQLRGLGACGPAADVWSLAATLYECLALLPPFRGRTTAEVLQRIERGHLVPLRRAAPGVPKDLETIVAKALDEAPERRYADAGAFADDLQRLLDLQPIQAQPPSPMRRVAMLLRRHKKQLLAAGLGALLVAVATFPLIAHAMGRDDRRAEARSQLQSARSQLLQLAAEDAAGQVGPSRGRPANGADDRLHLALAAYDRSMALDEDAAVRHERDVARLAIWLRNLTVPTPDALEQALASDAFARLCAPLGPRTVEQARRLAAGSGARPLEASPPATADPDDLADLGLLAFLCGDAATCQQAWSALPATAGKRPLVDAVQGVVLLRDGRADLAHLRLSAAQEGFTDATPLADLLAECCLELGDAAGARRWLSQARPGDHPYRARLALDVRIALGEEPDPRTAYATLAARTPSDPMPRLRLALLAWRAGDAAQASAALDELLATWPSFARARLERGRIALQRHDAGGYLQHVLAVLTRSVLQDGAAPPPNDEIELLRLGGLRHLLVLWTPRGSNEPGEHWLQGGEMPLRSFLPDRVVTSAERLLVAWLAMHRAAATLAAATAGPTPSTGEVPSAVALFAAWLPWPRSTVLEHIAIAASPLAFEQLWPTGEAVVRELRRACGLSDEQPPTLQPMLPQFAVQDPQRLGNALLLVDDCTGDGYPDMLVAAESLRPTEAAGCVFVVDGRSGTTIATLDGDDGQRMFGHSLAKLGDVDGDGGADWLIGAPSGTPTAAQGAVEIWSGRTWQRLSAVLGDGPGFGVAVAALDDVDDDRVPDFAVATVPMLRNSSPQGSVQLISARTGNVLRTFTNDVRGVWFGASLASIGDLDGDGRRDLVIAGNYGDAPGLVRIHSTRTGALLQSWTNLEPTLGFATCALGVGDVDGDGRDDVAVSAVRKAPEGVDQVFLLSTASGRCLRTITRPAGGMFGYRLATCTGGRDDLMVIGAPLGGRTHDGTVEIVTWAGETVASVGGPDRGGAFGGCVAVQPDDDGDGRGEIVIGPGTDPGRVWRWLSGQRNRR